MASPLRLRILRLCLDGALTNQELAQRLGRDPASVLYHVRRLVAAGFLAAEPARRGVRGSRELPYRSTGKSWHLDVVEPRARRAESEAILQVFLDELAEAGTERLVTGRLGIRLTEAEQRELNDRMMALLDEFVQRRSVGEPWSLFIAAHPDARPVQPPADPVQPPENGPAERSRS